MILQVALGIVVLAVAVAEANPRCDKVNASAASTPLVVCVNETSPKITLHQTEGSPVLATLALPLGKDERVVPASLEFIGHGFIEVTRGPATAVVDKRAFVFELTTEQKLAVAWTSPTCSKACLQDFSFWYPSDKNQFIEYTYVQYPRAGAEKHELVKVQRFKFVNRKLTTYGGPAEVKLEDWFKKGLICEKGSPLCAIKP